MKGKDTTGMIVSMLLSVFIMWGQEVLPFFAIVAIQVVGIIGIFFFGVYHPFERRALNKTKTTTPEAKP